MSRWKHPFQALSSVDVDTLTREALSAFLSKKELANQIAKLLPIVVKKNFSYSYHSKIVFFCFFFVLFFLLLYELSYTKKRTSFLELMSRNGYF